MLFKSMRIHYGRTLQCIFLPLLGGLLLLHLQPGIAFSFSGRSQSARSPRSHIDPVYPLRAGSIFSKTSTSLPSTGLTELTQVHESLGLQDRFDRWRYLQKLLDGETEPLPTNQLLYFALKRYLTNHDNSQQGLESTSSSTHDDQDVSLLSAAPEMTPQRRQYVEAVLSLAETHDGCRHAIPALVEPSSSSDDDGDDTCTNPSYPVVLEMLERLLPDPEEEEDAFKSNWDIVIDIHGREGVKIAERDGTPMWKARSLICRILLFYDFLTDGPQ